MQPSPKLFQFAEVCLGTHYTDFRQMLDDFQKLDMTTFRRQYPALEDVSAELGEQDWKDIKDKRDFVGIFNELLLFYAQDKMLMASVDWAGDGETVVEKAKDIFYLYQRRHCL